MKLYGIMALAALATILITSCKTTEKNYRTAYERTMTAQDTTHLEFEQTIYGRYRRDMRVSESIVGGDTVATRIQRVFITPGDSVPNKLKTYNLIIGQFKQLFNANSMRQRLRDMGYTGAFVVQTAEPYYYVVAQDYDDQSQAAAALKRMRANPPFRLRDPLPFLLRPAR